MDDSTRWDGYVRAHAGASPYHLDAWRRAVERAYGHAGCHLIAAEGERVVGLLPLFEFRVPFGGLSLVSSPFCDLGGPLADNEGIESALVAAALEQAQARNARSLELRCADAVELPPGLRVVRRAAHKVRMVLELPDGSEALLAAFKAKLRSQVRKAEKNGCEFVRVREVDDFYRILSANMRDLGSPVHSRSWFAAILEHFGDDAFLGLVTHEGRPIAAGLALSVGERMTIPWASSLRAYNRLAANMLLYWNLLRHAADSGFAQFDFGRSSEGEGTYRFKAQWGAAPHPLHWIELAGYGEASEQSDDGPGRGRLAAEAVWRRLPLPLANLVGPRLRKYVSL